MYDKIIYIFKIMINKGGHMKENMDIFDFSLTEEEISYLSCIPEAGWSGEHPDI